MSGAFFKQANRCQLFSFCFGDADMTDTKLAEKAHDQANAALARQNEAAIRVGESAIKAVLLANGGAVVAVLAFYGNLSGKVELGMAQLSAAANSLIWFAAGEAAGLICILLAYLTNLSHANVTGSKEHQWEHPYVVDGPSTKFHDRLSTLVMSSAIVCGTFSMLLFIGGICAVRASFLEMAN